MRAIRKLIMEIRRKFRFQSPQYKAIWSYKVY